MSTQSNRRRAIAGGCLPSGARTCGFRRRPICVQTALVVMGGIVGVVAGLQGLLGAFISSDKVAVTVALLLVATGAVFIVAIANDWHRRVPQRAVVITIAVMAPLALGVGLGVAASRLFNPASDPPASSPRAGSTVSAGPTLFEVAANRRGTPVFRDPQGAAVPPTYPRAFPTRRRFRSAARSETPQQSQASAIGTSWPTIPGGECTHPQTRSPTATPSGQSGPTTWIRTSLIVERALDSRRSSAKSMGKDRPQPRQAAAGEMSIIAPIQRS